MHGKTGVSVGVIIPVYSDAAALERLLNRLLLQWQQRDICVVDGGSDDGSAEVAKRAAVHFVHAASPCRARQMNQGAATLKRDAYWFLHADAVPPPQAKQRIQESIASGFAGGAFRRRFDSPSRWLRATCWLADWRGMLFGWFLGDQGIFASRRAFERVGGFPELPLFEDLEFSRALGAAGRLVLVRDILVTSARRFARRGPFHQTMADLRLTMEHLRGSWLAPKGPPRRASQRCSQRNPP